MSIKVNCEFCSKEFVASTGRRLFCSDVCKTRYNRENRLKCFYCGELASSKDHITAHSTNGLSKRVWDGVDYVPCCNECNILMGDKCPYNFVDKIDFLITKFTKKYKLNKGAVQWDEEELTGMGKSLANWIRAQQLLWNKRGNRLVYMRARYYQVIRARDLDDEEKALLLQK